MTNTGERAGEETVQLYFSQPVASVTRSVEDLRGFQKVRLQPGETREVTFRITPEDLKFYNEQTGIRLGTGGIHHPDRRQLYRPVKSATVHWSKKAVAGKDSVSVARHTDV